MLRLAAAAFGCLLFVTSTVADPLPTPISPVVHFNGGCTGFAIQPGLIVTAGHCILALGEQHMVLSDGSTVKGEVSMFSSNETADDIALISMDPVAGQDTLALYCGPVPLTGTEIRMTGYPGRYGLATVWGRVAGTPRPFAGVWGRLVVPINISSFGGFSGSPVVNDRTGEVVGILVGSMPDNKTLAMMVPSYRLCEFIGAEYV